MWLGIQMPKMETVVMTLADPFFFFLWHPASIKIVMASIFSSVSKDNQSVVHRNQEDMPYPMT